MKSIKTKLMLNFFIVVFLSVSIFECILIYAVKNYYYKNLEDILGNQIQTSCDFYSRFFSHLPLDNILMDGVDIFWQQTSAEVQLIDTSSNVIFDSLGVIHDKPIATSDIKKALNGKTSTYIGKVPYDSQDVMAVSSPLISNNKVVGVLRFVSSLSIVHQSIKTFCYIFIAIGAIVILISIIVSIILSNSILHPLKTITSAAEKMSLGNFNFRIKNKRKDELGKLSDTLNIMADEIQKKEDLKNDFISSISHELRTPLTSIKGWAITLNSTDLDDKQLLADGLGIIEKESDRLKEMVEELLDFSKFASGKISLNKRECSLNDIINHVYTQLNPRALRDNLTFENKIDKKLPSLLIDENRIKQVLINIIDNAMKFTPECGKISIFSNICDEFVTIIIEDTGCGINEDELPKVKEKFYKGKNIKSQNGLGLSIADEIITLHGGSLNIKSKPSIGTSVYISLPLKGGKL